MDNQVKTQTKLNKNAIKADFLKRAYEIDGIFAIKDIKGSYDKDTNETIVDVYIVVEYGYKIPDVAWNVQELVSEIAYSYTGNKPKEVNIHVQGVKIKESNV